MGAYTVRQRADPTQDQPTVKWRGDRTSICLNPSDSLEEVVIVFGDHNASKDIAVSAEIFGSGMHNYVGP